jgi:hypothetical protein
LLGALVAWLINRRLLTSAPSNKPAIRARARGSRGTKDSMDEFKSGFL